MCEGAATWNEVGGNEASRLHGHKDLDAWKLALELVKEVYELTRKYPKEELYGLATQVRRSAVSIPSNIAEGAARNSKKEFLQFLHIALGSCAELETQLFIAKKLGYVSSEEVFKKLDRVRLMLLGLIRSLKHK